MSPNPRKPRMRFYPVVTVCPDPTPVGLAALIRHHRVALGLRQADLATALGLSRSVIAGYETGAGEPSLGVLRDMASLFKVSLEALVNEKRPRGRPRKPKEPTHVA